VVVKLAPDTEAQVTATAFTDSRERGFDFSRNTSEGVDGAIRLVGRGRWGWQALAYVQTRNFTSDFAAINDSRTTATQTLDQYDTPASGWGGRLEIAPPIGGGITLRLGADTRQLTGQTNELFTYVAGSPTRLREAGGRTGTTGIFADASIEAGILTATVAARLDWWTIKQWSPAGNHAGHGRAVHHAALRRSVGRGVHRPRRDRREGRRLAHPAHGGLSRLAPAHAE
jgi:vitamin B12 transporter